MKKLLSLILVLSIVLISCSKSKDSEEACTSSITLNNTSTNPYKVYINGVLDSEIAGGKFKIVTGKPAQNYTVRILQVSGYVLYPTDQTFDKTLTCNNPLTFTFPQ